MAGSVRAEGIDVSHWQDGLDWTKVTAGVQFADVRVRTCWMTYAPDHGGEETPYVKCLPDAEGAFECWEIR